MLDVHAKIPLFGRHMYIYRVDIGTRDCTREVDKKPNFSLCQTPHFRYQGNAKAGRALRPIMSAQLAERAPPALNQDKLKTVLSTNVD